MSRRARSAVLAVAVALLPAVGRAQDTTSLATLRVGVSSGDLPVEGALVRAGAAAAQTDAGGRAVLRVPAGSHLVRAARIGFLPESVAVVLRAAADTSIEIRLATSADELEEVVVSATRGERRIEDEAVRVEVLVREEIEEKMLMTPGDVAMMLNETSGLRVQTTSPSLGGASVRIQGLAGRYTQVLSDGLPLYGGQAGALGLLQIPPMDLAQVEVIKGAASALYGAQALGGVVNLVSRRPGPDAERELLVNATTRGGADGVLWLSRRLGERWGYTLLAGAHGQERRDVDEDGWTDLPGYRRAVVRPRMFWSDGSGRSLLLTAGTTLEDRVGGTLPGRTAPDGAPYAESLDTRRLDAGTIGRFLLGGGRLLTVRGSATGQRHAHRFGAVPEDDRHLTWFGEASLAVPHGRATWIGGAAFQRERYRSAQLPSAGFDNAVPSAFAQVDVNPSAAVALGAAVRLDAHDEYGTFVDPRLSLLVRASPDGPLAGWTARGSAASGTFAPTPFTEDTEVTGLTPVLPIDALVAERALTGSIDVNGTLGGIEVNGTLFGSVVRHPVAVVEPPEAPGRLRLVSAARPTRTSGTELLARWRRAPFAVTGSWTFIESTELDPTTGGRRVAPLVPRHAVGVVAMWEREDVGRAGLELYHTGRQSLDDNPYRAASPPYLVVGLLVERRIGRARFFVNAENLGDVRQTKFDPLVRATPGPGGRWTTDAWTELAGRTINGGVRWEP